jgi:hypothetical protein
MDDFDRDDRPLLLEMGLADSYVSLPDSWPWPCPRAIRAKGDMWSSSLSEIPFSMGTELVSDSDVCIVVVE